MDFSYDILREDKVNIKKVRMKKLTGTEDEPIRALLWEQIIIDILVGHSWGNVSRIK